MRQTGSNFGRVPNILIVDDTPENLDMLAALLKAQGGYETRPVSSGRMALTAVRNRLPDLILLDINMPSMDGYEVCEQLKADPESREIPVIFISAYSDTLDKVRAFSVGGVDYITKPFQHDEVMARVRAHIQLREYSLHLEELVEVRTQELAAASERVAELSRIKDDFLAMIAHELRTPASGLLGFGELLANRDVPDSTYARYRAMYIDCATRLQQLIDDAHQLAMVDVLDPSKGQCLLVAEWCNLAGKECSEIAILTEPVDGADHLHIRGVLPLLLKAFVTLIRLAKAFSRPGTTLRVHVERDDLHIRLRIPLDRMWLTESDASHFFVLEGSVRGNSSAQSLGLAPVVADRIVAARGGAVALLKDADAETGAVEIRLPLLAS